jgi:hypothetical protein
MKESPIIVAGVDEMPPVVRVIGKPTKKQRKMMRLHGTPIQFELAVQKACEQLCITSDEATKAIANYRRDFLAAGSRT